jgi:hypothetical protein
VRRRALAGGGLTLVLLFSACSSPSVGQVRHVTATTSVPTTTGEPPATLPSAVPTTVPGPVVPEVGWSRPATSLPPAGGFTSLSCISDVFCLSAGGGSNEADTSSSTGPGVVASWDGAAWSPSATYFATSPGIAPPPWLAAIDCTHGPLCAVVDGSGHTAIGDGTTWSLPAPLPPAPAALPDPSDPGSGRSGSRSAAVSCSDSRFCAYVDNTGHVATMNETTWSTPQVLTTRIGGSTVALFQSGRVGVSCSNPSRCTALLGADVLDWNGISWLTSSAPWGPGASSGDAAVSCPLPGTCVAVHGSSVSVRTSGGGWSPPRSIDGNGHLDALACPTVAMCVASDAYGYIVRLSGGVWTAPLKVVPTPATYSGDGTSLSCPTDLFCMVLNGDGDYVTWQGAPAPVTATTTTTPLGPGSP